jgi:tungstate transport system ATP-binding protein
MSLYRLEHLRFAFGERAVLDIPALTIADGRITALTGPNGSGKTTLLMLLGLLLRPSSGRILYRGTALPRIEGKQAAAVRREIGLVLQAPYLFHTTVGNNVAYGLAVRGMARRHRVGRVREALRRVGLEGFEVRPHHALSGGEVQRVALARTLITGPRVLLLDEPLANVDGMSRTIIERVLVEANRHQGVAVLFATHDLDQAYRLADTVVTLNAGMVVQGTMENVYHGTVRQHGDGWGFDTGHLVMAISAGHRDSRTAAVLPEAILLSTDKVASSARNVFCGRIVAVRDRQASVEVTVDAGEMFTARITGTSYREMDLRLGQEVYLVFKAEAVRLY